MCANHWCHTASKVGTYSSVRLGHMGISKYTHVDLSQAPFAHGAARSKEQVLCGWYVGGVGGLLQPGCGVWVYQSIHHIVGWLGPPSACSSWPRMATLAIRGHDLAMPQIHHNVSCEISELFRSYVTLVLHCM